MCNRKACYDILLSIAMHMLTYMHSAYCLDYSYRYMFGTLAQLHQRIWRENYIHKDLLKHNNQKYSCVSYLT